MHFVELKDSFLSSDFLWIEQKWHQDIKVNANKQVILDSQCLFGNPASIFLGVRTRFSKASAKAA